MRFVVAVKQVPNTGRMSLDDEGNLTRAGVPSILNPYCELALVKALELREEGDTVDVFTMGPPQAESSLRRCLELGADNAYLITDPSFAGSDTWATSRAIESFVSGYACDADLILFGRQSIDGDTGQVPFETAGLLDVQQFAYAESITRDGDSFRVMQNYGSFVRTCHVPRGSVVAFSGVDLRGAMPTLEGFMRASKMDITKLDRVALGLGAYSVGSKGSPTRIARTAVSDPRRKNRMVVISNPDTAANLLIDEAEGVR